ncbi:hypothetical protein JMJ35_008398 [Cladonia borealis]|uniref:Uncharacterized protein n=1 Tax=Cladonia borealis TaxID=184061 RepID=A0AA39QTN6_9LECA|nr:hypothetical protein JMJ35_008398 [Cladonia borealis]
MADLDNTRLSDSNGSDTVSNGSSDNVEKFRKLREDGFDPENPPPISLGLNILFSFASAASVANIYYNHPIPSIITEYFFLCPLDDIFRRRAFVLILTWFTATLWLGLCLTRIYKVFAVISFLTSITTVTPQLILPLVGDLAPPERHAQALSLVVPCSLGGMLIARLLSGIVNEYSSWRIIYWTALGIQYTIVILMYLFMLDYLVKNKGGLNYSKMLWDILLDYVDSLTYGTYTGKFTIAGPVIQDFPIDIGLQTSHIADRTAIYALEPKARNRFNTMYMVFVFTGQLTGTALGNQLYAQSG